MTERSDEIVVKRDLGSTSGVLPEVVEFLGEENVARVETLVATVYELKDLSSKENPFRQSGWELLTPEVEQVISSVPWNQAPSQHTLELQTATRQAGPTLGQHVDHTRDRLLTATSANDQRLRAVEPIVDGLQELPDYLLSAPDIFVQLQAIAGDMPEPNAKKVYERLLAREYRAIRVDGLTTMLLQNPSILNHYCELVRDTVDEQIRGARLGPKHEELTSYSSVVTDRGLSIREVKKSHRKERAILKDMGDQDSLTDWVEAVRASGSQFHETLAGLAKGFLHIPAAELFDLLADLKSGHLTGAHTEALLSSGNDHGHLAAVAAERYIAEKAAVVELGMRHSNHKIAQDSRRILAELKDTSISRRLARLASQVMQEVEKPHANTPNDPGFRKRCKEVREILAGGGRSDDPLVRQLADKLHRVQFVSGNRLEPAESGLIVAIVSGRINALQKMIDRFEKSVKTEDPQVEKLKHELPSQYLAIKGFDIDLAIQKLSKLIAKERDRHTLLIELAGFIESPKLVDAIDSLVAWRTQQDETPSDTEVVAA